MALTRASRLKACARVGAAAMTLLTSSVTVAEPMSKPLRVVYIEASTGRAWNLPQFPQRASVRGVEFEFVAVYDFDKTAVVGKVLGSSVSKPDVVVLQECSAYFPGPLEEYKALYRGWVEQIRQAGVRPVMVTTVPPAEPRGLVEWAKAFVKHRVLGRPSEHVQIVAFNDWVRVQGRELGVPVLDLEAAVRGDAENRWMNGEYDKGDGTHLNAAGYEVLDRTLKAFVADTLIR